MSLFLKADILADLEEASRKLAALPFNEATKADRENLENWIRRLERVLAFAELLDEGRVSDTLRGAGFSADPKVYGLDGDIDKYLNHSRMYEVSFIIQSMPYEGEHAVLCFYRSDKGTLVVRVGMRYPARQVWAALNDENELAEHRIEPFVIHRKVVGLNNFAIRSLPVFMPRDDEGSKLSPGEIAQRVSSFLHRKEVKIQDGFILAEDASFLQVCGMILDGWWRP